jgi:hypothetical protein
MNSRIAAINQPIWQPGSYCPSAVILALRKMAHIKAKDSHYPFFLWAPGSCWAAPESGCPYAGLVFELQCWLHQSLLQFRRQASLSRLRRKLAPSTTRYNHTRSRSRTPTHPIAIAHMQTVRPTTSQLCENEDLAIDTLDAASRATNHPAARLACKHVLVNF